MGSTMTQDEQALRTHLQSPRFLAGEDRNRWCFNALQWPYLFVNIMARDQREFTLRLNCSGYPSEPPTGTFWDQGKDLRLDFDQWPKGGERIKLAFRPEWKGGNALYIPCDRESIAGHPDWINQYRQLIWKPAQGITHYLEVVYDLLQSHDYICSHA